ncbi:hypothetical protein O1M63_44485 [Streptomyces mirabilis]|uniref:hypothetical protein n=1 Tax=Streptomyces mirabilis TaxID=68239 RepID=UPI0022C77168|nr:hypothetical protein [Streptomyces mirabilis]
MTNTPGLRPEDRADFESVLHLALGLIDIRSALLGEPTVRTSASLYAQALAAAEEITAAASDEYRDYLAVRKAAERLKGLRSKRFPTVDGALWPALVVLTPLVAGAAAAVLLLIGYGLHLADAEPEFAASVTTAGWVLALTAMVTALVGLRPPLRTAVRRRSGRGLDGQGPEGGDAVEGAREKWRQALLERGVLPYLRSHLPESLAP